MIFPNPLNENKCVSCEKIGDPKCGVMFVVDLKVGQLHPILFICATCADEEDEEKQEVIFKRMEDNINKIKADRIAFINEQAQKVGMN